MSGEHERMKDEVTLLALGITPDIPVTAVMDHMAECAECRRLLRDVYETAGRIPETFPDTDAPEHVRDSILRRVRADEAGEGGGNVPPRLNIRHRPGRTATTPTTPSVDGTGRLPRVAAFAAVALLLIASNFAWLWRSQRTDEVLATVRARYESNTNWLRSAEYLLIRGEPPAYSGPLVVPAGANPRAAGQAALYYTSADSSYLLVRAESLREQTVHSVWVHRDGRRRHLGDFTSTETGVGSYVYSAKPSEWAAFPEDGIIDDGVVEDGVIIDIQDDAAGQVVLIGTLRKNK